MMVGRTRTIVSGQSAKRRGEWTAFCDQNSKTGLPHAALDPLRNRRISTRIRTEGVGPFGDDWPAQTMEASKVTDGGP
jgi:hypothetical protein